MYEHIIRQLEAIDFEGKGESFVEARFLPPLLECLGYETHKDYEVIRHGDDGSAFKLQYPPVERGAVRVKHYNPDYIPTIRKKMFWVIEAKSPKDVSFPFDERYIVQGLQYCIHPEIQAKYLLVTNGIMSAVYDAHGAVFFGQDIYEPIYTLRTSEISYRWASIYELLAVDKIRTRIEADLKAMYDKLSLSSLDRHYPGALLRTIGASQGDNSRAIEQHVRSLQNEMFDQAIADWRAEMESLDAPQVFARMDVPTRAGGCEAQYYIAKCENAKVPAPKVLSDLTHDFDQQSIFRKIQTFLAVCILYVRTDTGLTKSEARAFLDRYKDADLPYLNQVECCMLRMVRKVAVLSVYPQLREKIRQQLQSAPELVRLVHPPTAFGLTYGIELDLHRRSFEQLKLLSEDQLKERLQDLLAAESAIESDYRESRSKLTGWETQIGGFEGYGLGGKHYAFRTFMHELGIESPPDLVPSSVSAATAI
jgi:hypothetical protein